MTESESSADGQEHPADLVLTDGGQAPDVQGSKGDGAAADSSEAPDEGADPDEQLASDGAPAPDAPDPGDGAAVDEPKADAIDASGADDLAQPDAAGADGPDGDVATADVSAVVDTGSATQDSGSIKDATVPCPGGCDDKNGCTVDLCDEVSGCAYMPNTADCDDGLPCTVGETCIDGLCDGGAPKSCDDKNVCTLDACEPTSGQCSHLVTKLPCDDGDKCTNNDFCWATGCSGQPSKCDDANPCTDDTCEKGSGCQHVATTNSTGCDDGQKCTAVDTCVGAACMGTGNPCDDKNICTADVCKEGAACAHLPIQSPCDDGVGCTEKDHCVDGKCGGAPKGCDDANPCTADGCTSATGDCAWTPIGGACSDGDACTIGDVCLAGVCAPGPLLACTASGPCVTGVCDAQSGGCQEVSKPDGVACGALDGCTSDKVCTGGVCSAGVGNGCDDGNPCTTDQCASGGCQHATVGGPCDDGKLCTSDDTCAGEKCVGKPASCEDANPCTAGSCSPTTGGCEQLPTLGIPCSDGNPCSVGDLCAAGKCAPGLALDCDDKKPCTDDICIPTGCLHTPLPNGGVCSDGDVCTVGDSCIDLVCTGPGLLSCNDGNDCTVDQCVPALGCQHVAQNLACSDGDCCTSGDHCALGKCVADGATTCDDGLACTVDACLPQQGCAFSPSGSAACGMCVGDDFEGVASQWATWSDDPTFVKWTISTVNPRSGKHALRAVWKAPPLKPSVDARMAYIRLRKVLLQGPAWLVFDVSNKALTQGCTVDTLHVLVNGKELWKNCNGKLGEAGNPLGTCTDYEHVAIDLSSWAGSPVDIDIRLDAGTYLGSGGSVDIDNLQVLGSCAAACVGVDMETHDPGLKPTDPPPKYLMPAWPLTSTEPAYTGWKRVATGGHTGVAALQAAWKGAPTQGKSVVASLALPVVTVEPGAKLMLWSRAIDMGDKSCGDDDFEILVGGQLVYTACGDVVDWKQHVIDLGAWAGKATTVELRVRSGAGSGAAGLVQVDDLAITGDCTYRCYFEDFAKGMSEWQSTQAKGLPAWKESPTAYSPPLGLAVELTAGTAEGAKVTLAQAPVSVFILPARGAIWKAQVQVEAGQSACPAAILTARGQVVGKKAGKGAPAAGPSFDMATLCSATSGWQLFAGDFSPGLLGQNSFLQLVASRPGGVTPTLRVDDAEILCR